MTDFRLILLDHTTYIPGNLWMLVYAVLDTKINDTSEPNDIENFYSPINSTLLNLEHIYAYISCIDTNVLTCQPNNTYNAAISFTMQKPSFLFSKF